MPTPADIRRRNLRQLVERDTLAVVARRMKKPERQINDMISEPPRKSFGEKVARSMEAAYDPSMPAGWLDRDDGDLPDAGSVALAKKIADQRDERFAITEEEVALLRDLRELLPEKRERYAKMMRDEATEARAYKAMVVERFGEPVADAVVARYIKPAPQTTSAIPAATDDGMLPGRPIPGHRPIPSGVLTVSAGGATKTRKAGDEQ